MTRTNQPRQLMRCNRLVVCATSLASSVLAPNLAFAQSGSLFHAMPQHPVPLASYPANVAASGQGVVQAQALVMQQAPKSGPLQNGPLQNGPLPMDTMSLPPNIPMQSPYGANQSPNTGLSSSWTFIPPAQTRRIKIHDIVSIRVDESANSLLLGNATSRKTTTYDAVVRDWVRLSGLDTLKPSPQSDGDPRAQVNQNEVYRGDSTLRTSESISFNIASQVVDILPNGLIVLEGNTTITLNDNSMEVSLIGTCRSEDIAPDNTVLSRNLVNKHIKKREDGHVRDGYSRGWLTRLFAKVKPF